MHIVTFMDFINTIKYVIIRIVNVIIEPINALIYWLCRVATLFMSDDCPTEAIPYAKVPSTPDD